MTSLPRRLHMTGFESNFFWIAQKVSVSEASKNSQISLPKRGKSFVLSYLNNSLPHCVAPRLPSKEHLIALPNQNKSIITPFLKRPT
jgi:hypothetical protein